MYFHDTVLRQGVTNNDTILVRDIPGGAAVYLRSVVSGNDTFLFRQRYDISDTVVTPPPPSTGTYSYLLLMGVG